MNEMRTNNLGFCREKKLTAGIVHSIDIHPSRKHTCLVSFLAIFSLFLRYLIHAALELQNMNVTL
jgi:hypothetical protein